MMSDIVWKGHCGLMVRLGQHLRFVFLLITDDTPIPLFSTTFHVLLMKIYLKAVIFFAIVKRSFLIGIHLHQNIPKIQAVGQGKRMKWKERKVGGGEGGGSVWRRKKKEKSKTRYQRLPEMQFNFFFLLSFYIASYFSSHFVNFNHRASVETNKCTLNPTGRIHYH